jgi:hypothetical protein
MTSAIQPIRLTLVVIANLVAASTALAAGAANDGGRRTGSFNLVYSVAAPATPTVVPSAGASVAPSTPVVRNPYHVPLSQGAGSLRLAR